MERRGQGDTNQIAKRVVEEVGLEVSERAKGGHGSRAYMCVWVYRSLFSESESAVLHFEEGFVVQGR